MNALAFLGFDILRPAWFAATTVALFVLGVGVLGLSARARARAKLVAARHLARFLPGHSENRARLRLAAAVAALAFLALALVGPVRGYTLRDVQRKGLDLVLCIDTSRSMLVQDVKPDRLTRAKREVVGLLSKLHGDRAALLAFAGDVREVAPLTHDRSTLSAFVNTLTPEENLKGGTDLGVAIDKALELFDGRSGAHEAIVLLTDGEDLEAKGLEAAKKAKSRGIRVYVVGMGTQGGGKIPDEGGRGFMRDESGKEVVSNLDGASLQEIARATDGAYLSVQNSPVPLEELYEKRIARLETRDLYAGKERIPHDRYQWPLVLALVFVFFEFALRERRAAERPAFERAVPPALPRADAARSVETRSVETRSVEKGAAA